MTSRTAGDWIATGLFCAVLGSSGFAYLGVASYLLRPATRRIERDERGWPA